MSTRRERERERERVNEREREGRESERERDRERGGGWRGYITVPSPVVILVPTNTVLPTGLRLRDVAYMTCHKSYL